MKRHHLFFLLLTIIGALTFGSNAFAGGLGFNAQTGTLSYYSSDATDTSLANTIEVGPSETAGFQTWVKITYDWWNTGPVYWDQGVYDHCFVENGFHLPGDAGLGPDVQGRRHHLGEAGRHRSHPARGRRRKRHDHRWRRARRDLGRLQVRPRRPVLRLQRHAERRGRRRHAHGGDTTPVFGKAADVLHGGPGDDKLEGGQGADQLWGDAGKDTAWYAWRNNPITASLDDTANDGEAGENDYIHTDIEAIQGGLGKDTLCGGNTDDTLKGGPGDDTLNGYGGSDYLYGEEGVRSPPARGSARTTSTAGTTRPTPAAPSTPPRTPSGGTRSTSASTATRTTARPARATTSPTTSRASSAAATTTR